MSILNDGIADDHWLLLVEDSFGLGRVLGFAVYDSEREPAWLSIRAACDACGLFEDEEVPEAICTEVMTYADFKESYGNRMPLHNRAGGK